MLEYSRAAEFYEYALNFLGTLGQDEIVSPGEEGQTYRKIYSEEQQILRARIERKLTQAKKLLESEQYGADWVLYRDGEQARSAKEYAKAYLLYEDLLAGYPQTVYAEAVRCYRIKTLLELATREGAASIGKTRAAWEKTLAAAGKQINTAKRNRVSGAALRALTAEVNALNAKLQRLQKVPEGGQARQLAEKDGEAFLKANQWGLYRGEVLLDLGNYYLLKEIDGDKAAPYYDRAEEWFSQVRKVDADLQNLAIPGKAVKVASPPAKERYVDSWGNKLMSAVEPGKVFNRRTSDWYLFHWHKYVVLYRGLLAFAAEDYPRARAIWEEIFYMDEYFAEQAAEGWGTVYTRLIYAVVKTPGAIYLKPEHMVKVKGKKKRMAVLLADLFYVNEEPFRAREYYEALLAEKFGANSREERAVALFGVFAAMCWDFDADEVAFMHSHLEEIRGTAVEAQALRGMGNRSMSNGEIEDYQRAIGYFEMVRKRCPKSKEAKGILFKIGNAYFYWWEKFDKSKKKDAVKYLTKYLETDHKGYRSLAAEELKKMEEE